MKTLTELKTAIMTKKSYKILGKEVFVLRNRIKYANDLNTSESEVLEGFREANCEIVNVNFSIGSRDYNKKAYKVGKSLYTCTGLTKLTAYFSPEIIPEITEQMIQDSISDSYYY